MRGVIYATTVVHRPDEEPYNVCLVDLEEGGRVMGRVDGVAPEDVQIGQRVQARTGDDGITVYDRCGSAPSSAEADAWV
jgi:uncharacterized protein